MNAPEKVFMAKAVMTATFPVYNMETKEQAERQAFELAEDLVRCTGNSDIMLEFVEVEE